MTTQAQAIEAARRVLDACGQTRTRPPHRARRDRGALEWNVLWDDYWVRVWDDTGLVWNVSAMHKAWSRRALPARARIQSDAQARAWVGRVARAFGVPGDARLVRLSRTILPPPARTPLVNVLFDQPAPGGHPYLDVLPHLDMQLDARDGAIESASQDWGRYVFVTTPAHLTPAQAIARAVALYQRFLQRRAAAAGSPPPRAAPIPTAVRFGYSGSNGSMVRNGELETDFSRAGRMFPPIYPMSSQTPYRSALRLAWAVTFGASRVVLSAENGRLIGFYLPISVG